MNQATTSPPGIIISALKGGSGKTVLSLGIIAALKSISKAVAPFKKGPDYIDAGWLSLAAGRKCYNLDTYLFSHDAVINSFLTHSKNSDISVVEGNRGLYDGIDLEGNTSTAEIAKLLKLPVILCLDCTKSTRTVAATILGCLKFDTDVDIKGVVLNRIAGLRHRNIVTQTIEHYCGIKVIGVIPKLKSDDFPERHMGLVPTVEHEWAINSVEAAKKTVFDNIDFEKMIEISQKATENTLEYNQAEVINLYFDQKKIKNKIPTIGIIRDSSFQFYYPENIKALEYFGAKTIIISPLKDKNIPDIDGLYIGGGFPEIHAKELADNKSFKSQLKTRVGKGLPVYAECGGLMYLGKELVIDQKKYPMTGIFPISYSVSKKPQGHGYIIAEVDKENPFFQKGTILKGHEFRYSKIINWDEDKKNMVFKMERGTGMQEKRDGVCYKNVLATYAHIHVLGIPAWAEALVKKAVEYKNKKGKLPF